MASTVGPSYTTTKAVALNADLDLRVLGFQPRRIVVHNLTNNYRAEWNEQMADAEALVTSDIGARSVVTSNGFTPLAGTSSLPPGVRLGALANINDTTTEDLLVEAWG